MLKDITLGQYFPGNTVAHRLDPRTKILLVTLYIIALFSAKGLLGYMVMAATLAVCVKISKVGFKSLVRGLKPLVVIIAFTGILNIFFTPAETYLLEWASFAFRKRASRMRFSWLSALCFWSWVRF